MFASTSQVLAAVFMPFTMLLIFVHEQLLLLLNVKLLYDIVFVVIYQSLSLFLLLRGHYVFCLLVRLN